MAFFTKKFKKICIKNKHLTKKINRYRPDIIKYSYWQKSIIIKNNNDIDNYFQCYRISDMVKKLCNKWLLSHGGCYLDFSKIYCGHIYLTKTKRPSFYNHIHIFNITEKKFKWHNKKTNTYGEEDYDKKFHEIINKFKRILSN
jgi:hypothetical protein